MRLFPAVLSVASGTGVPTAALQHAQEFTGNRNICGAIRSSHNGTIGEEITLEPEESCIYRIRGDKRHVLEVLNVDLQLDCADGEMWMFTDYEKLGPFCNPKRRRRDAGYGDTSDDAAASYATIDPSNLHGQNFKSKEVDMVFKNGQRARFKFGFNFEFELLPGMPLGGGLCKWKNIKASNAAFYTVKDKMTNPELAMNLWNTLTESMYKFQCHFDRYRTQCEGMGPVEVSCGLLDWTGGCGDMIAKLGTIIETQCAECTGNGICAEWYGWFSQLQGLHSGAGISYGGGYGPIPYCDEKQCSAGTHDCDAYATCTEECQGFTCTCNEGYENTPGYDDDGKYCQLICDEDQCDVDDNPCGDFSICTNECIGFECTCEEGFEMITGEYTSHCSRICDEGYENINNECIIICEEGYIITEENTCYKVCDVGYENIDNECVVICPIPMDGISGFVIVENKCELDCIPGYHTGPLGTVITDPGPGRRRRSLPDGFVAPDGFPEDFEWPEITEECIKDCDEDQCLDPNSCPEYSTCTNDCYGHTCECIDGYHKEGDICELTCLDDPCANGGAQTCGDYSTCENKCLKHECGCIDGYSMIDEFCVKDCDEDPCAQSTCGAYSTCIPTCYGHTCECEDHYIPIDGDDESECKHEDPCHGVTCPAYASCNNGVCECDRGYAWKGDICAEKINECITGEHNCHKYATCHDDLWGFHCTCNDGYKDTTENEDGTMCVHPYYTNDGECFLTEYSVFTDKKFESVSYSTSYDHQSAVHYWKMITAQLSDLGREAERTVQCAKEAGIIGCKLINYEKDATACDWAHTLETVVAEVQKQCNEDWSAMYIPFINKLRLATCVEPNDCESGIHNCDANAVCEAKTARYGSKTSGFRCICNEGFYGNGRHCFEEVDECAEGIHKCALNANCADISAGYKCICHKGYVGNGYKCSVPVDECTLGTHDCHEYASCTDLPNGFTCKCRAKEGYVGNGKHCTGPADECTDGTHTCHDTTDCVNTYAGFSCKCKEGYLGDPKKGCWPPLVCPWTKEVSANNYGGYAGDFSNGLCSLKYMKVCTKDLYEELYAGGMKVCKKNDAYAQFQLLVKELFAMGKNYEKKYGVATSHFQYVERYGAECSVEAGAVPCQLINFHDITDAKDLFARVKALFDYVFKLCDPVYRAKWEGWLARYHNSVICPVNECKTGNYKCHENASCVDRAIGYDCVCKKHFYGDGFEKCDMINYCDDQALCGLYATCKNLEPGYECSCMEGYYRQGHKCIPADPCKKNNGGCSEYATCHSQIFGYEVNHHCKCHKGYYGDGFTCDPIDPCEQNNCDANADCLPYQNVLTEADYDCKCKKGYEGNGFICEKVVDPCENVECKEGETTNIIVNAYGMKICNCVCAPGYIKVENVCEIKDKCMITECDEGYKCVNNGECVEIPSDPCENCHAYAQCKTMGYPPAKQCVCKSPYVGDGFACRDPKPCTKECKSPTVCVDGSCACPKAGLWFNWAQRKCLDKNECVANKQGKVINNCSPNATCKNTHGGFTCTCNKGYAGDGVTCNEKEAAGQYQASGNPYAGAKIPSQNAFDAIDSTSHSSIGVYTELSEGQCSLMGYEWANLEALLAKMKWSQNKVTNENNVKQLLKEFQYLGKSAIARSGPQCNLEKAGIVDCALLYFPHNELRCQLVQRIKRVYDAVATNCNNSWQAQFGSKINSLLQNNQSGKKGAPCDAVEWLH